jgi:hypothetical protein
LTLKYPFATLWLLIAVGLSIFYVIWEIRRRGGLTLANLQATFRPGGCGSIVGLFLASGGLVSGLKVGYAVIAALFTDVDLGLFGPQDLVYLAIGGVGAIWFGLAGIIEMFVYAAKAGP